MTKAENEKNHTIKRLSERFNINISEEEYNRIRNAIRYINTKHYEDIEVSLIGAISTTKTFFKINYKGIEFKALYSNRRHTIVTVLSNDMTIKNLRGERP